MFWRDRMRHEIQTWSERSSRVFYGSALLILVDFAAYFWPGRRTAGLDAFAFIFVLILAGYAMWRVWRGQRSSGYLKLPMGLCGWVCGLGWTPEGEAQLRGGFA